MWRPVTCCYEHWDSSLINWTTLLPTNSRTADLPNVCLLFTHTAVRLWWSTGELDYSIPTFPPTHLLRYLCADTHLVSVSQQGRLKTTHFLRALSEKLEGNKERGEERGATADSERWSQRLLARRQQRHLLAADHTAATPSGQIKECKYVTCFGRAQDMMLWGGNAHVSHQWLYVDTRHFPLRYLNRSATSVTLSHMPDDYDGFIMIQSQLGSVTAEVATKQEWRCFQFTPRGLILSRYEMNGKLSVTLNPG